mmetsp:Transcript_38796/g.121610  ORF Transcript_38796/g.121610 Transcript_38796/m.121610 type:complete len:205 (-) Transcript_38796:3955-4569(-)
MTTRSSLAMPSTRDLVWSPSARTACSRMPAACFSLRRFFSRATMLLFVRPRARPSASGGSSRFRQSHTSWSSSQRLGRLEPPSVEASPPPASAAEAERDGSPLGERPRGMAWCTTTPSKVRSPGPGAARVPGGGRKVSPGTCPRDATIPGGIAVSVWARIACLRQMGPADDSTRMRSRPSTSPAALCAALISSPTRCSKMTSCL